MTVTPYDIGTFHVSSENGKPDYLVDLAYLDEWWRRPRPVCGCPDSFAKGFKVCKHILATVEYEKARLNL